MTVAYRSKPKLGRPKLPADQLKRRGGWRTKQKKRQQLRASRINLGTAQAAKPFIERAENLYDKAFAGYSPLETCGDCWYDSKAGARILEFFERYVIHVKGRLMGKLVELEDWQAWWLCNLFGWMNPDGTRRYRESFFYVPRKNGKSFLGSGIGLYGLFGEECEGSGGSEIYCAGASKDNARVLFDVAKMMVKSHPSLDVPFSKPSKDWIERQKDNDLRYMRPIPADASTQHGGNAQIALLDEVHAQPSRHLYDVLRTSVGARDQPLMICLTTADFHRESVCNELHKFAAEVRDGIKDDESFFPLIYEASPEDDWRDEEVWKKANPNYGISVSPSYIQEAAKRAEDTPGYLNTFLRLHLNVQTATEERWINMEIWESQKKTVNAEALLGEPCYCGIDLSSNSDLTAIVLVFPRPNGEYHVVPHFWAPEEKAVHRDKVDRVPYLDWSRRGLIKLQPGAAIDQQEVLEDFFELGSKYNIKGVGIDAWNAHSFAEQVERRGINVGKVAPGASTMNDPCKFMEACYLKRRLIHGNNPVLTWMARNAVADIDRNNNIRPVKGKSSDKIDGITALAIAMGEADLDKRRSIYDGGRQGVIVI